MTDRSSLIVDVRPGEFIDLDGLVTVELVHKSGQLARLRITAPAVVSIQKKSLPPENSRGKDAKFDPS